MISVRKQRCHIYKTTQGQNYYLVGEMEITWGLIYGRTDEAIQVFLVACEIIAGILKWTTLLIQTAPGAIALIPTLDIQIFS